MPPPVLVRVGKPGASVQALEEACRAANAHEFIAKLPQGYETVIGERGIRLSGGQRQRIAIARAILRDAPILVLDEALSAVDAENEAIIQDALDRLMEGRTTLIFAHRLSSVIDADRILVLDGGCVAETGRHGELMARGGVYHQLMSEQEVGGELVGELVHRGCREPVSGLQAADEILGVEQCAVVVHHWVAQVDRHGIVAMACLEIEQSFGCGIEGGLPADLFPLVAVPSERASKPIGIGVDVLQGDGLGA